MLKFIGSGSAFNTKLGNNSAFYKNGNQMLLIDCGSNIFQRIKENNLLDGIKHIHVLVTHTHADHVGSLADLILYTYYSHGEFAKSKVTIHSPFDTGISEILKLNGCTANVHHNEDLIGGAELSNIEGMGIKYIFKRSKHVGELYSYGISMEIKNINIWYSGDCSKIPSDIHVLLLSGFLDYAYIDTCKADYEGNVHLSLKKLEKLMSSRMRNRVWCMHLDEGFIREEAEALGFNVVNNII